MNKQIFAKTVLLVFFCAAISLPCCLAQTSPLLKRTTYKTDKFDFGSGGTVSIVGAPNGSIRVEGWQKNEIEISAEIEVQAATEADMAKLAGVTGFMLEESLGRTGIISIGTHDKKYMKRVDKKFPKNLFGLPFKIDYVIKVPQYCDLQIDGGKGDLSVSAVDGTMNIKYLDSNAKLNLIGGGVSATFGSGTVEVTIPTRSWRGRFADIQLATGTMKVRLPLNFNAEIDASILRTGTIDNAVNGLKPRSRNVKFTEKSIVAKAGNGGIPLKFTVGDGTLGLLEVQKQE